MADVRDADDVFAVWTADVRARGGQATVDPRTGRKAERFGATYRAPPPAVQAMELAVLAQERADITAGEKLQLYQDAFNAALGWVASLPKRIVESAFGLPAWVIPVGAIALAIFLARQWGTRR